MSLLRSVCSMILCIGSITFPMGTGPVVPLSGTERSGSGSLAGTAAVLRVIGRGCVVVSIVCSIFSFFN